MGNKERIATEYPIIIDYVKHKDVFGDNSCYIYYCGRCGQQIYDFERKCEKCGAILRHKEGLI